MKNKKLYEYEVDNQLNYQFIKRISINEQTKTVWFELIVMDTTTNEECAIIKSKSDFTFEETNGNIKDFLIDVIQNDIVDLICELDLDSEIENIFNDQLDNGFVINGKEFLLKNNNYAELREKVLKEVKEYGLH